MILASLFAHLSSPEALSVSAILTLLTSLALSSTAGLRAYLPLLALAVGSNIDSSALPLQPNFATLKSPPLIIILAILTVMEFVVDKVPVIDHFSDAVHTVIRPISGAIIMAGTQNSLSDVSPWLAAGAGALAALVFHGIKATARPVVTASTAGIGNPIVSTIEDVITIVVAILSIVAPVIAAIVVVVLGVLLVRLLIRLAGRLRARNSAGPVAAAYQSQPTGAPTRMPTPVLQMPNAPPNPGYPPAGGYAGDPPTMPGQMH